MSTEKPAEKRAQIKDECAEVPYLMSTFVDAFVDYAVGGQFLHRSTDSKEKKARKQEDIKPVTTIPAPERLIAIGDVHGDLKKTKEALQIAEVMDENEQWIGGKSVVVQLGDLLDRGSQEIKIIYLLEKLKIEAQRHGGDVHVMTGNHEIMNMNGNFRDVTPVAMSEFKHWADWYKMGNVLKERCKGLERPYDFFEDIDDLDEDLSDGCKARMAALRPGGPITSRFLAPHPVVLVVGSTVFVHGGLLEDHVTDVGLQLINQETRDWMQGKDESWEPPYYLQGRNKESPVWTRVYSHMNEKSCDCQKLEKALKAIPGTKRIVMGHTIQADKGINTVCGKKAVRVDVGMSAGCGDFDPEVLEIRNDHVMTVLSSDSFSPSEALNSEKDSAKGFVPRQPIGLQGLIGRRTPPINIPVNLFGEFLLARVYGQFSSLYESCNASCALHEASPLFPLMFFTVSHFHSTSRETPSGVKPILSRERFKECVVPPPESSQQPQQDQSISDNLLITPHRGMIANAVQKVVQALGVGGHIAPSGPRAAPLNNCSIKRRPL